MLCRLCPRGSKRRAIAAVELAVVLPALLLFVAAVVDLGRLAKYTNACTTAARNGAQYASTNPTTAADTAGIRTAVMREMQNLPNTSSTNPTVSTSTITRSGVNFVRVTVTYNIAGTNILPVYPVSTITKTIEMRMNPSNPTT